MLPACLCSANTQRLVYSTELGESLIFFSSLVSILCYPHSVNHRIRLLVEKNQVRFQILFVLSHTIIPNGNECMKEKLNFSFLPHLEMRAKRFSPAFANTHLFHQSNPIFFLNFECDTCETVCLQRWSGPPSRRHR